MTAESEGSGPGEGVGWGPAWSLFRRWWWLVFGVPVAVTLISLVTVHPPPAQYQARLSFAVDIPRSAIVEGSDEGSAAKVGEALVDDTSRIIGGDVFAAAVQARLPRGMDLRPGEVASSLSATDRHRIVDVTVTRAAADGASARDLEDLETGLIAIAEAVVDELEENGGVWFARLGEDDVRLTIVDRPDVAVLPTPLRARLELPLRVGLSIAAAVGLAALLHVLDPRLHTEAEARSAAGVPVLGLIPRRRRNGRQ